MSKQCSPPRAARITEPTDSQATTAPFAGLLVLVDRPDSPQVRADECVLAAAGACVLSVAELRRRPAHAAWAGRFSAVVLLADAAVADRALRRLPLDVQGPGGAFVIVIGAGSDSAARAGLLRRGVDDCLDWPYLPEELAARIEALLRRRCGARNGVLSGAGLRVDVGRRSVRLLDVPVPVTRREFDLLAYLLGNRGVAFTRQELLAQVWGYDFGGTETVTVHIRRLRAKIERDPGRPQRIVTVRGHGYLFAPRDVPAGSPQLVGGSGSRGLD